MATGDRKIPNEATWTDAQGWTFAPNHDAELQHLRTENAMLKETLAFYANRYTYAGEWDAQFKMYVYQINNDGGKRARAALKTK